MRCQKTLDYTGDKGYKLVDVLDKKVSMEEFIAQISEEDLIAIFRGEGMCSPKVTAGTAAAFGGVTDGPDCAWNSGWLLFGWSVWYPYGLWYEGVFSAEWNFSWLYF